MPYFTHDENGELVYIEDENVEESTEEVTWREVAEDVEAPQGTASGMWSSQPLRTFTFGSGRLSERRPVTGMAAGCKKLPTHLWSRDELRQLRDNIFFMTTDNRLRRTMRNMIKLLVEHKIYSE